MPQPAQHPVPTRDQGTTARGERQECAQVEVFLLSPCLCLQSFGCLLRSRLDLDLRSAKRGEERRGERRGEEGERKRGAWRFC